MCLDRRVDEHGLPFDGQLISELVSMVKSCQDKVMATFPGKNAADKDTPAADSAVTVTLEGETYDDPAVYASERVPRSMEKLSFEDLEVPGFNTLDWDASGEDFDFSLIAVD
jgi:hypothetical protein